VYGLIIIASLLAVCLVYLVGVYQGLVALRDSVQSSWAGIDVLLKQRHDELPKLIESCRRCLQFEQAACEKVMRARAAIGQASATGNVAAVSAGEQQLRAGIGRLFAVAAGHPQLQADKSFRRLQARIAAIEAEIAARRELYNERVNLNNIRLSVLPDAIVANWFGFKPAHLLECRG
jgi:LemA protein